MIRSLFLAAKCTGAPPYPWFHVLRSTAVRKEMILLLTHAQKVSGSQRYVTVLTALPSLLLVT